MTGADDAQFRLKICSNGVRIQAVVCVRMYFPQDGKQPLHFCVAVRETEERRHHLRQQREVDDLQRRHQREDVRPDVVDRPRLAILLQRDDAIVQQLKVLVFVLQLFGVDVGGKAGCHNHNRRRDTFVLEEGAHLQTDRDGRIFALDGAIIQY